MARKKRQRISYVLPLPNSLGGHRLGVNGLAIDQERSILYSGGRDGVVCSWDVNGTPDGALSNGASPPVTNGEKPGASTFRSQIQAHTHWVNDIVLTQNNSTLVSCSSDVTVKAWRPEAQEGHAAKTIGAHSDYVKCLSSPGPNANWVASGGLDHKIFLWDLNKAAQALEIDIGKVEGMTKGSVYALSARDAMLASGGPESVVRLWDPRTGKSITKLVGHTDNVRSILISDDGSTLMTASSDQTVKVWSMAVGRCMHTLTMHNDSVWSLFSDHPQLSVFHSSDRAGLVAKTDTTHAADFDEGLSVAVCQEHDGVAKLIVAKGNIWTASFNSSINRWEDVNTQLDVEDPPTADENGTTNDLSQPSDTPDESQPESKPATSGASAGEKKIPYSSILRLAITSPLPGAKIRSRGDNTTFACSALRKASEAMLTEDLRIIVPVNHEPEHTIHGQNGLIKHVMLNDRRRVVTLDSTGEVVVWDLLKCKPVRSLGRRSIDDVVPQLNTTEAIANWCSVDTRTGGLSVALEEKNCFDAEVYADELENPDKLDFREDQRINLGKWVLRNLFTNLIDEEIRRDGIYRRTFQTSDVPARLQRTNAPPSIAMPTSPGAASLTTPRQAILMGPVTPGMSIGAATPAVATARETSQATGLLTPTVEEDSGLEKKSARQSNRQASNERNSDYFSSNPNSYQSEASSEKEKAPATPNEVTASSNPTSPVDEKKKGLFGKNFKMAFPKNMKLGRNSIDTKPAVAAEEKPDESDKSSEKETVFEDNFLGVIQRIRYDYEEQAKIDPEKPLSIGMAPSLPNETPVQRPPPSTMVIIQEDNPESGGVADLYRGGINVLDKDADLIEKVAPMWLGDLLLRNQIPLKDTVKVSFVLQPYQDLLPSIASPDGNARLNAYRMLRAKKILTYVAERIEAAPENEDPKALKPEEYLELYCNDQLVDPSTTLATLRVHHWRGGGDVTLYYKANSRKQIKYMHASMPPLPPTGNVPATEETTKYPVTTSS